jgi:hypothetical protein
LDVLNRVHTAYRIMNVGGGGSSCRVATLFNPLG